MKLTKEDKIKIIELHNLGYGSRRIAKQFSIETPTVKRLVAKYKIHGECVTEVKHTKRKFSVEYKLEVIQRIENGETENSIANELLLNHGLIRSWVKKYKELGYNGLIEKPKGRPKIMNPEEMYPNLNCYFKMKLYKENTYIFKIKNNDVINFGQLSLSIK